MGLRAAVCVGLLLGGSQPVRADVDLEQAEQIEDIENLSLAELLEQPVTSASRYAQKPGGSPVLVSTIDAELIQALGYRTVGEALRGMRGVYTTNDRNYSYLGTRGFSLPGDYNTRFAVSIDNHHINDPVYGQGNTGAELGLPMIAVERIELIRGGAWSVHGESALLGAVQVVTASGATRPGIHVTTTARATAESFDDPAGRPAMEARGQDVSASYGMVRNGYDLFIAGSYSYDPGLSAISMPELAVGDELCVGANRQPGPCDGIVHGADGEEVGSVFAAIKKRDLAFRTLAAIRSKEVPTAAFDAVIGDEIFTVDTRLYGDLEFNHSTERGDLVLRLTGDHYRYAGTYPYQYDEDAAAVASQPVLGKNEDGTEATWWGAEARGRLKRERYGRYLSDLELGGGAEGRRARGRQFNSDVVRGTVIGRFDRTDPADRAAIFGHASARAFEHVVGFVAGRGDYYPDTVGLVFNPQLGVVLDGGELGRARASLSRGHRSPNLYERFYGAGFDGVEPPKLEAEKSETREVSIERYLGPHLRLLAVAFRQDVTNLITLKEADSSDLTFENVGSMRSHGVEVELEGRWDRLRLRSSYTRLATRDDAGRTPANSPESLANLTLVVPFAGDRGIVGVDSWYVNKRLSFDGTELVPYFMTNVAVTINKVVDRLDLTLGVTNLFDQRSGDPGSEEHRQSVIPHDPRVVWARLAVELP
jgi:outer membrane receptor for ferrienterochelin and colicins